MQDLTPEQEKKLRIAYKQTFGSDIGQIVFKHLEATCYRYTSPFVPGDPYATHVNIGISQVLSSIEELMSDEGIKKLEGGSNE